MRQHIVELPCPEDACGTHRLAYTEWGDTSNPNCVFCVHGLSRNSRDFDYLASALSTDYRVVCIDIVGRGKSQWLSDKSHYNYQTYVQDSLALLDHLGMDQVHWIGTSMGGIIAMLVAQQQAERINKLILNDIGFLIPAKSLKRIIEYVGNVAPFDDREHAIEALRVKLSTFGIKDPAHWQHIFDHGIVADKDGKSIFNYDPAIIQPVDPDVEIEDINLEPAWETVTCPTLIIRGGMSDVLLAETAKTMESSRKNVTLMEFPNIGHAPMLMDEQQIAVIKDWL